MNHEKLTGADYCYNYRVGGTGSRFEMSLRKPLDGHGGTGKRDLYIVSYQSIDGVNRGTFNLSVNGQTEMLRAVCSIPGYKYIIESPTGEKVTVSNRSAIGYH